MDGMGSHIEATVACAVESGRLWPESGILELGVGDYSTPLLHHIARVQNRPMLSVGCDATWLQKFRHFENANHEIRLIRMADWETYRFSSRDLTWGFALMDSDELIVDRFKRLPNLREVGIVVVHDGFKSRQKGLNWAEMRRFFHNVILVRKRYPLVAGDEEMDVAVLSNFMNPAGLFHPDQVEVI